jgi:general secretion pathway protein K
MFRVLRIDITEDEANDLAHAVIDWIDEDSETELGAEDEYYQALQPPYHCKNAPMDSAEEILLVRGMKPEYFFGTENYEGIRNHVATGTGGKININTATEAVLMSLSDQIGESVAASIVECRPFLSAGDYGCIRGCALADGATETTWIRGILDVKSTRFCVDIRGACRPAPR